MTRALLATVSFVLFPVTTLWSQQQDQQIASALSAAPASIAEGATVEDWNGNVLRQGDNGWTCFPDDPDKDGNSPMCLDGEFVKLLHAWKTETEPTYERVGWGYMLQGGEPASNTDPYAQGPEDAQDWMTEPGPPHIMMVVPDPSMLDGIPTDPANGGPWVMWKGTPLVHVMIPSTKAPGS